MYKLTIETELATLTALPAHLIPFPCIPAQARTDPRMDSFGLTKILRKNAAICLSASAI